MKTLDSSYFEIVVCCFVVAILTLNRRILGFTEPNELSNEMILKCPTLSKETSIGQAVAQVLFLESLWRMG